MAEVVFFIRDNFTSFVYKRTSSTKLTSNC